MKKRNTAIRALSVFLAYAMVCTSVPAAGQEMFGSESTGRQKKIHQI